MRKARVGIVGCGEVTRQRHIPAYKRINKRVEICGLCDHNLELARDTAKSSGVNAIYDDVDDLVTKEEPDIIDICVPPKAHISTAISALEGGCHVVVEKPMAMSVHECDEMISVAKRNGLRICTIHNDLFHPSFLKAKRIVERGEIGSVIGTRIFLSTPRSEMLDLKGHWYHELPGGVIGETAPHVAYIALWHAKEITRVSIFAKSHLNREWAPFDDFRMELEGVKGNCSAMLSYSNDYWAASVDMIGPKGEIIVDLETMQVDRNRLSRLSYGAIGSSCMRRIAESACGFASNALKASTGGLRTGTEVIIERYIESLAANGPPPVTSEEGREVVRVMEMVLEQCRRKLVTLE